jgi:hypothetical protein
MTAPTLNPPPANKPASAYPKQAIIVIHGMGEQRPMDTLRGFVRSVWELDSKITANGLPNPADVWSKPDLRTGSLELRRITTRQSIPTHTFSDGVRSDFYELYWADLSGGSTWSEVKDWIIVLLLRNPFTRVPRDVFLAWILLWVLALAVVLFSVATILPEKASVAGHLLWSYPPLSCLSNWQAWQLAVVTALITVATNLFVVPYFGRVVRYTRATPENIAARKNIRERGLALLSELHKEDYSRIVVVGHSLGSILAYDLISYFWATRYDPRTVLEHSPEFQALLKLERAIGEIEHTADPDHFEKARSTFLSAQREFCRLLRLRPRPTADAPDTRWLITDLVTLGSPLTHAEFLLARDAADLRAHQASRDFPVSPPIRELLDPAVVPKAKAAGFPLDADRPQLICFPFGSANQWQLHHAAPFAAVRWTNIHDPALLVILGDLISGPIAPIYGPGVIDIDLRRLRGQSLRFSHTRYWSMQIAAAPPHVAVLRDALDLAGQRLL